MGSIMQTLGTIVGLIILGILIYLLFKIQKQSGNSYNEERDRISSSPPQKKPNPSCLYHNQLESIFHTYQVPSNDRSPLVTLGANVEKATKHKIISKITAILEGGGDDKSKASEILALAKDKNVDSFHLNSNADTNTQEYSYKGLISQIIDFGLEEEAINNFANVFEEIMQRIQKRALENIFGSIKYQLENLAEENITEAEYKEEFDKIKRNLGI